MDESDSDAEPQRGDADQDEEKYPVDGIFISLAEKGEIMALPELRREEIMADRAAEVERNRQNRLLRQLVNVQESEEKKQSQMKKKRTADAADLEDSQRKSTRPRTRLDGTKVGEISAGIDSLRKARAEKSDRQRRREEERLKEKASPSVNRGRENRASSEEWLNERHSRTPEQEIQARELPPAELKDFERVRAGRRQFAERCFDPGFEQVLTGCYVRINMGTDQQTGQPQYRMAVIKGG